MYYTYVLIFITGRLAEALLDVSFFSRTYARVRRRHVRAEEEEEDRPADAQRTEEVEDRGPAEG